jgi:hypothetical protein
MLQKFIGNSSQQAMVSLYKGACFGAGADKGGGTMAEEVATNRKEDATLGERSFEELAKGLSDGSLSRRQVLRLFAGAFIGGLVTVAAPWVRGAAAQTVTTEVTIVDTATGDMQLLRGKGRGAIALPA